MAIEDHVDFVCLKVEITGGHGQDGRIDLDHIHPRTVLGKIHRHDAHSKANA